MKKKYMLALAIFLAASTTAFAATKGGWAVGIEGALNVSTDTGLPMAAMFSLHAPRFPLMFGFGVSSSLNIGFTADYWFAHGALAKILDWYAGVGMYGVLPTPLAIGARIPVGVQSWPFGKQIEVFLEGAPAIGISVVPTGIRHRL
jgi:hypothetical protein